MKNYLLLDYDGCTQTLQSTNPCLLSPKLLSVAAAGSFDGFYGFTHRTLKTDRINIEKPWQTNFNPMLTRQQYSRNPKIHSWIARDPSFGDLLNAGRCVDFREVDPQVLFTSEITKNVERVTGIPCVAVSTPDDTDASGCGAGYSYLTSVWEDLVIKTKAVKPLDAQALPLCDRTRFDFNQPYPTSELVNAVSDYDDKTKNPQMIQTAWHASRQHPDEMITLHYYDDRKDLCSKVLNIDLSLLPSNVIIEVILHDSFSESCRIEEHVVCSLGAIKGTAPLLESACSAASSQQPRAVSVVQPFCMFGQAASDLASAGGVQHHAIAVGSSAVSMN